MTNLDSIFKSRGITLPTKVHLVKDMGKGNATPIFLPGESYGQWSLEAAVHGVAQSWTRLKRLSMHECIGEENGNPLQYSCLEKPMDRGVWWAAIYGVPKSQTRLK